MKKQQASPGTIALMVVGIIGALAFAVYSLSGAMGPTAAPVKTNPAASAPATSGAGATGVTVAANSDATGSQGANPFGNGSEATLAPESNPFVPAPGTVVRTTPVQPVPTPGPVGPTSGGTIGGGGITRAPKPPIGGLPDFTGGIKQPFPIPGGSLVKVSEEPELVGTLLGGRPSAVFRAENQGLAVVPVGAALNGWKVISVQHGAAIIKPLQGNGKPIRVVVGGIQPSTNILRGDAAGRAPTTASAAAPSADVPTAVPFLGMPRVRVATPVMRPAAGNNAAGIAAIEPGFMRGSHAVALPAHSAPSITIVNHSMQRASLGMFTPRQFAAQPSDSFAGAVKAPIVPRIQVSAIIASRMTPAAPRTAQSAREPRGMQPTITASPVVPRIASVVSTSAPGSLAIAPRAAPLAAIEPKGMTAPRVASSSPLAPRVSDRSSGMQRANRVMASRQSPRTFVLEPASAQPLMSRAESSPETRSAAAGMQRVAAQTRLQAAPALEPSGNETASRASAVSAMPRTAPSVAVRAQGNSGPRIAASLASSQPVEPRAPRAMTSMPSTAPRVTGALFGSRREASQGRMAPSVAIVPRAPSVTTAAVPAPMPPVLDAGGDPEVSRELGTGGRLSGEVSDATPDSVREDRGLSEPDTAGSVDGVLWITPDIERAPNEPADAPLNRTITTAKLRNSKTVPAALTPKARQATAPAAKMPGRSRRAIRRIQRKRKPAVSLPASRAPKQAPVAEPDPFQNGIRVEPPTSQDGEGREDRGSGAGGF